MEREAKAAKAAARVARAAKEAKEAAKAAKEAKAAAKAAKEAAEGISIMEEKERYDLIALAKLTEYLDVFDSHLACLSHSKFFVNRAKEKERDYLGRCVQIEVLK